MNKNVDEYTASLTGPGKEWVSDFVGHIRKNYPHVSEGLAYQVPTYKIGNTYFSFSVSETQFTFQARNRSVLENIKILLPRAKYGKDSIKVSFEDPSAKPVLLQACRMIIEQSNEN